MKKRVILGVSGASGAIMAVECARLLRKSGAEIDLVLSDAGKRTIQEEIGGAGAEDLVALVSRSHPIHDVGAAIASGSCHVSGMIVAPCSMRSLAAIANGFDDNLLTRSAHVQLKERRPLILLAREAPLTLAHLSNMTSVTQMGAIVMPPVPAFYLKPKTLDDIAVQIAARAVDLLSLCEPMARSWHPSA